MKGEKLPHTLGKTCFFPGDLPSGSGKGRWLCEMRDIPIRGVALTKKGAQTYPGKTTSIFFRDFAD